MQHGELLHRLCVQLGRPGSLGIGLVRCISRDGQAATTVVSHQIVNLAPLAKHWGFNSLPAHHHRARVTLEDRKETPWRASSDLAGIATGSSMLLSEVKFMFIRDKVS